MSVLNGSRVNTSTQGDPEPMVLLIHQSGGDMSRIHDYLERAAFRVRRATSYPAAIGMTRSCHPDVIVLQTDATDSGLQLMREILSERAVPVIILAPADHSDPVQALELGADDHMINPPALPELAARARGAARRSRQRVRRVGALELDAQSRHARASNRRLSLTPTEYSILEFLAQTPGHAVTHHDLVQAIGAPGEGSTSKLVPRISRLRLKLSAAGVNEPFITSVRGVGYRLDTWHRANNVPQSLLAPAPAVRQGGKKWVT